MILTPEEQTEYREEIDYLIETRGYEYVWGHETAMDKTKGLLRDAPAKIAEGLEKLATNRTVIEINEKLKNHAANLNAQDEQRRNEPHNPQPRMNTQRSKQSPRRQPRDGLGGGSDLRNGFNSGDDHL